MKIKEELDKIYNKHKEFRDNELSKLEFLASETFNLTTYDSELDKLFVSKIIEVIKVIVKGENFEYIENEQNYINYILVCQLLDRLGWIDWGTSIRGAWLEDFDDDNPQPNIADFWQGGADGEIRISIPYSKENVISLIEWVGGSDGDIR